MTVAASMIVNAEDLAAVAQAFAGQSVVSVQEANAPVGPDFVWYERRDWEFTTFFRDFAPHLVNFLGKHGAIRADAAEVAQDALSEAFRSWATITTNPAGWCRTTALRKMWERKQARSRETSLDALLQHGGLPREWASGDDHFVGRESIEAVLARTHLLQALHRLPLRQRQIFAYTSRGYTPAEIADLLQLNPGSVRSSLHKARITLAGFANELLNPAC